MKIKQINTRVMLDLDNIIKLQLVMHFSFKNIHVSESELDCLIELAKKDLVNLKDFCNELEDNDICSSSQYARNLLSKLEKKNIIEKSKDKKQIRLNKSIKIENKDSFILNIKAIRLHESIQVPVTV
jgi:undecaprenyl pyrophosphate synthase